jgi:hypothetical protein
MSGTTCTLCEDDAPLARLRYFPGQLMTAEDMRAEQDYFRMKLRRHNRFLHGWGVSCGLEVRLPQGNLAEHPGSLTNLNSGPGGGSKLWVCPGYAVSPQGDDIVVPEPVSIDIASGEQQPDPCCEPWPCPPVTGVAANQQGRTRLWLAIRAAECLTRPVRIPATAVCGCDANACDYSRIRESFELKVLRALPKFHSDTKAADETWRAQLQGWRQTGGGQAMPVPPCPPCTDEPWVVLATLIVQATAQRSLDIVGISTVDRRVLLSTSALQVALLP